MIYINKSNITFNPEIYLGIRDMDSFEDILFNDLNRTIFIRDLWESMSFENALTHIEMEINQSMMHCN